VSQSTRRGRIPRAEARRRILDAASRLLRDRRFRDLTVDAVMAEAGLSRTVFYRHFESLGDLVIPLLEELGATLEDAGDVHEVDYVKRVLERVVRIAVEHGPLLRAIDEAASHDDEVERAYRGFVDWSVETTTALFEESIRRGTVRPVANPRAIAHALTLMNGSYLIDTLGRDPDTDPDEVLEALTTIWYAVLMPPERQVTEGRP
jgi:TetR/AcrR family transcriptional regulator, ethionamide resistance regulator